MLSWFVSAAAPEILLISRSFVKKDCPVHVFVALSSISRVVNDGSLAVSGGTIVRTVFKHVHSQKRDRLTF